VKKLKKRLVDYRKESGMSQQELADIVGISRNYISEIENGVKRPSGPVALRLAETLGFDMSIFFENESRKL
jgi:putative transcriptional regulator